MPGKSWHEKTRLLQTEDWWAVWVGLLVILLSLAGFWAGSPLVKDLAVTPGKWSDPDGIARDLQTNFRGYLAIFFVLLAVFSLSMKIMGHSLKQFVPGFVVIFVGALAIFYLAGWAVMERWDLGAPLLALIAGLVVGNLIRVPGWLKTSMRVEFYIKTGIVLLGATLPLTLIVRAGGLAFLQATVVSLCTWFAIFLAATRLFHLDKRFGAVLGAGGAVCGVSASIAVGGAVGAKKDQIAISIGVVSVWAIIMIFVLTFVTKQIIPADGVVHPDAPWYAISPGELSTARQRVDDESCDG